MRNVNIRNQRNIDVVYQETENKRLKLMKIAKSSMNQTKTKKIIRELFKPAFLTTIRLRHVAMHGC
jgi:hypothetical protein